MQEKDAISQEVKDLADKSQRAPYADPPQLFAREFVPFEPVTIRGYCSSGGWLVFDSEALSEVAYAHQLNAAQELLDREILARVDVLKRGTTDLIGSMVKGEDRIKQKMGEILLARANGG